MARAPPSAASGQLHPVLPNVCPHVAGCPGRQGRPPLFPQRSPDLPWLLGLCSLLTASFLWPGHPLSLLWPAGAAGASSATHCGPAQAPYILRPGSKGGPVGMNTPSPGNQERSPQASLAVGRGCPGLGVAVCPQTGQGVRRQMPCLSCCWDPPLALPGTHRWGLAPDRSLRCLETSQLGPWAALAHLSLGSL